MAGIRFGIASLLGIGIALMQTEVTAARASAGTDALGRSPGNALNASQECLVPPTPPNSSLHIDRNIIYYAPGGYNLRLDVIRPQGDGPFQPVLLIHGGYWARGTKSEMMRGAKLLAALGYAAVAVDFRQASSAGNQFPAAVQDLRCAVSWVRTRGVDYGLSHDKIFALGVSSGGHLASMLGSAARASFLDSTECPYNEQRPEVQGVIAVSAPEDFTVDEPPTPLQARAVRNFLGALPSENPELAARASPVQYVDASTPAFFLAHGTADTLVPISQAELMRNRLQAFHRPVTLVAMEGVGHELPGFLNPPVNAPVFCAMADFLRTLQH